MQFSLEHSLFSFAIGFLLGLLFFGGLWLTLLRLSIHARPGLLIFSSVAIRFLIILVAIHMITRWQAPDTLLVIAGFVLARITLINKLTDTSQSG